MIWWTIIECFVNYSKTKERDEGIKKTYRRHYHDRTHDKEMERHLKNVAKKEYIEPVV